MILDALCCCAGAWDEIGQTVVELCEQGIPLQAKNIQKADELNLKLMIESCDQVEP